MTGNTIDRFNGINSGVAIKAPCRVATTANITLSGEQTINGVAVVSGDRVLVKNQSTGADNGIYEVSTGAWSRTPDFDGNRDIVTGTLVFVLLGDANPASFWRVSTSGSITIGTTSIAFEQSNNELAGVSAYMTTLLNDATAAEARTTLDANQTTSALSAVTIASNDYVSIADTSGGNASRKALVSDIIALVATPYVNEFRLTLTSGVGVTTTDVTGATTIYAFPYLGKSIALYDGNNWNVRTSAQFSIALGTLASGKPYDVFCYDNSGVPTLELTAWTNDTTRATALVYQDGVLVKTGALTRRYLGTFYTTSTTTTEDSAAKRYLWNYYNRAVKGFYKTDATVSWTYTTATIRQVRADATNQVEFVTGVAEDAIELVASARIANTSANVGVQTAIGLDSTSAIAADCVCNETYSQAANTNISTGARLITVPTAGRHYAAWLEYSLATGTSTWTATGLNSAVVGGITGRILA